MSFFLEDGNSEEKSSSGNEPEETENRGTLEDQGLTLCRVVRENLVDLIKDPHGSHVLRTLIHVLAGCSTGAQSDAHPGGRVYSYHLCVLLVYVEQDLYGIINHFIAKYQFLFVDLLHCELEIRWGPKI